MVTVTVNNRKQNSWMSDGVWLRLRLRYGRMTDTYGHTVYGDQRWSSSYFAWQKIYRSKKPSSFAWMGYVEIDAQNQKLWQRKSSYMLNSRRGSLRLPPKTWKIMARFQQRRRVTQVGVREISSRIRLTKEAIVGRGRRNLWGRFFSTYVTHCKPCSAANAIRPERATTNAMRCHEVHRHFLHAWRRVTIGRLFFTWVVADKYDQ